MSSRTRYREKILTMLMDMIILVLAGYLFYSFQTDLIDTYLELTGYSILTFFIVHTVFWVVVLIGMGLYKSLYLISRFDEFTNVIKATIVGTLILYFLTTLDGGLDYQDAIRTTAYYSGFVGGLILLNRFVIRTIQRRYAQKGKGLHRAVIVGTGQTAKSVFDDLLRNKTLGMQVLGYINENGRQPDPDMGIDREDILGNIEEIENVLESYEIQDVIVALEPEKREDLVQVIGQLNDPNVSLKILPDFYYLVSGLNKTNQIFGLPLIEVTTDPMPYWEKAVKRVMDIVISALVLILTSPLMLLIAISIKMTSKGPIIYRQERVGRRERNFTMYKFRTMYDDAEAESGPTWAKEDDPRVTPVGYWLRKLRFDELPQFYNVLKGDMSLVGPRPERPYFVEKFKSQIPLYSRRLRVRPGITGWAQVKWKYDTSLEDVREKTKYDLFYVENMSLRMDFKILINTVFIIIRAKGR